MLVGVHVVLIRADSLPRWEYVGEESPLLGNNLGPFSSWSGEGEGGVWKVKSDEDTTSSLNWERFSLYWRSYLQSRCYYQYSGKQGCVIFKY